MSKVLLGYASGQPAQNGTSFAVPCYTTYTASFSTESLHQIELPAGKLRNFSWYQSSIFSGSNVTKLAVRVNGSESALSITAPAGTVGRFEDLTHEVTLAENDLVTIGQTGSAAPYDARISECSVEFEADSGHPVAVFASPPIGDTGSINNTTANNFTWFGDHGNPTSDESATKMLLRAPGSMSRLRVTVSTNTKTADAQVHLRINGADSGLMVTIPAGTTGAFTDTTHTVSVTTGDFVNLRYDGGGSGTGEFNWGQAAVRFTGSGKQWDMSARGQTSGWNLYDTPALWPMFAKGDGSATVAEGVVQARVPFNTIAKNLRIQVDWGIGGTVPITVKLRINGQDGDMAVTPPMNTLGWFEDISHYDQIMAGDLVCIRASAGSNNSSGTLRYSMVTLQEGLVINQSLRPGAGAVELTGYQAMIQADAKVEPPAGSLTVSGKTPHAAAAWRPRISVGRVSVLGIAPELRYSASVQVGVGALTISSRPIMVNSVAASQQAVMAIGVEVPPAMASSQAITAIGEVIPDVKATFEAVLTAGEIIPPVAVSTQTILVLADGERCTSARCQLWRITRRDGEIFRFTSLDEDYPWGDQVFEACQSLDPSAAEQQSVLGSTGNVELKGILSSDRITEADLYGGFYDDCFVEVWLANYDPQVREPPKRIAAGWAGNLSHGEQGFNMEVLGPGARLDQQALVQSVAPQCRWNFGDGRCLYNRDAHKLTGAVRKRGNRIKFVATISGGAGSLQWANGLCRWLTGVNAGQACEVKTVEFGTGIITLWALPAFVPQVADTFELLPGCDRSADTCKNVYGQFLNFGGYPDVPGTDAIADTPNAKT